MPCDALRQFFVNRGIGPAPIVAAVSGGVDSTALLLALADLRGEGFVIHAAHINHHLRGAESDADERFVRDLCARLGISLHVAEGTLDESRVRSVGVEAAAREVRYARLREIREQAAARYVATAHQKNDQAETVLMRILTGTGIAGLRGIHPVREDGFVRPLLEVTREEIETFLRERGITARHDRSNDDPRFLRNRVRALLGELHATGNLAAIAAQAQAMWPILERAIDEAEAACAVVRENETCFTNWPEDAWLRQSLLHRHIRRLDPTARDFDVSRIAKEVERVKRMSVTKSLELRRADVPSAPQGGRDVRPPLVLRRKPASTPEFELTLQPETSAYIAELDLTIHLTAGQPGSRATGQPFQVPANGTFTVRNRRPGDRFHPLGMPAPKKLKDFLIDRKIAADLRDRIPLLLWNDEIVWVAGVEVSERFKVTSPPREGSALYEVWMEGSGGSGEGDHSGFHR
ncbi:MAG TPA: tRNA lysidine(34) synthetase TilS [Thermoanaerobaculia bacterium]|nr:tRNA lysidine(34) synthetase TilS [Thermoanaerobaculia bacterium]